ncbi:MAG: hypothetical protein VYE18_06945 [Pseudomonadota bacterium]|nr:hypothetical protein [Pseudomonadota bacterium]
MDSTAGKNPYPTTGPVITDTVRNDVKQSYVWTAADREDYWVVIDAESLELDTEATFSPLAEMAAKQQRGDTR